MVGDNTLEVEREAVILTRCVKREYHSAAERVIKKLAALWYYLFSRQVGKHIQKSRLTGDRKKAYERCYSYL